MIFRTTLVFCVLMLAAFAYADNIATQDVILSPEGHIGHANPLDNPEPDTLFYDQGAANVYFSTLTNFWMYVRFTPPAAFSLRSVYFAIQNQGAAATCSVYVYLPNGTSPGQQLLATAQPIESGNFWYDCTLPDTLEFTAGQDFLIVIGRAVGPTAWTPLLAPTTGGTRTFRTDPNGPRMGPYFLVNTVNLRLQAGGSIATFTDIAARQCFDSVATGRGYFFMPTNTTMRLKAQVENLSPMTVDAYTVNFTLQNPTGTQILSREVIAGPITAGQVRDVRCDTALTLTADGEYRAKVVVHADNDAVSENDTTYLRFFVGGYPRWYRYDDDSLNSDGSTNYAQGNMVGNGFRPALYPCKIDSARIYVAADDPNGRGKIFMNNAAGMPTGNALWTSPAGGVVQGWNTIAVTPPVVINSGSFTLAYMFGGAANAGLGKDANIPNDAANTRMDTTVWAFDGSAWSGDVVGNWMLQAHLDTITGSAAGEHHTTLPASYTLEQNFPNPFNPTTDIQFALPVRSDVRLTVYDILGQEVASLVNGTLSAGVHSVSFNAAALPSGIYFYRLEAGSFSDIRKMVLMK